MRSDHSWYVTKTFLPSTKKSTGSQRRESQRQNNFEESATDRRWRGRSKLTLGIDTLERELPSLGKTSEPSQGTLVKSGDLDGSSVSRSSRKTLVSSLGRLSHLVLPGSTVPCEDPTKNERGVRF